MEEHEILEFLIEQSKPPIPKGPEFNGLDYLLSTPFRYPPLEHGSRFGKISEPSLWYGSLDVETALAEVAYYRFHFLRASEAVYKIVELELTSFVTDIATPKGIDLSVPPFLDFRTDISSPLQYQVSQALGRAMREDAVEAFVYFSARRRCDSHDKEHCKNVALFTPRAFKHKKHKSKSEIAWKCVTTEYSVEFYAKAGAKQKIRYSLEDFLVEGIFPLPA